MQDAGGPCAELAYPSLGQGPAQVHSRAAAQPLRTPGQTPDQPTRSPRCVSHGCSAAALAVAAAAVPAPAPAPLAFVDPGPPTAPDGTTWDVFYEDRFLKSCAEFQAERPLPRPVDCASTACRRGRLARDERSHWCTRPRPPTFSPVLSTTIFLVDTRRTHRRRAVAGLFGRGQGQEPVRCARKSSLLHRTHAAPAAVKGTARTAATATAPAPCAPAADVDIQDWKQLVDKWDWTFALPKDSSVFWDSLRMCAAGRGSLAGMQSPLDPCLAGPTFDRDALPAPHPPAGSSRSTSGSRRRACAAWSPPCWDPFSIPSTARRRPRPPAGPATRRASTRRAPARTTAGRASGWPPRRPTAGRRRAPCACARGRSLGGRAVQRRDCRAECCAHQPAAIGCPAPTCLSLHACTLAPLMSAPCLQARGAGHRGGSAAVRQLLLPGRRGARG